MRRPAVVDPSCLYVSALTTRTLGTFANKCVYSTVEDACGRCGVACPHHPSRAVGVQDMEGNLQVLRCPGRQSLRIAQAPPPFSPESPAATPSHPPPNHLLVTASFGRILSNSLLNLFLPSRRVNLHPSLLPMYRGAAPIQHALIDGQQETGVCVIEMTKWKEGIDSGAIWASQRMVSILELLEYGWSEPLNAEGPRKRSVPRVARLARQGRRPTLGVCHARHA